MYLFMPSLWSDNCWNVLSLGCGKSLEVVSVKILCMEWSWSWKTLEWCSRMLLSICCVHCEILSVISCIYNTQWGAYTSLYVKITHSISILAMWHVTAVPPEYRWPYSKSLWLQKIHKLISPKRKANILEFFLVDFA